MEEDPLTKDKTTLIDLALGKLLVKVEALKGSSKFEVRIPTAQTGVRGTEFEIAVEDTPGDKGIIGEGTPESSEPSTGATQALSA